MNLDELIQSPEMVLFDQEFPPLWADQVVSAGVSSCLISAGSLPSPLKHLKWPSSCKQLPAFGVLFLWHLAGVLP